MDPVIQDHQMPQPFYGQPQEEHYHILHGQPENLDYGSPYDTHHQHQDGMMMNQSMNPQSHQRTFSGHNPQGPMSPMAQMHPYMPQSQNYPPHLQPGPIQIQYPSYPHPNSMMPQQNQMREMVPGQQMQLPPNQSFLPIHAQNLQPMRQPYPNMPQSQEQEYYQHLQIEPTFHGNPTITPYAKMRRSFNARSLNNSQHISPEQIPQEHNMQPQFENHLPPHAQPHPMKHMEQIPQEINMEHHQMQQFGVPQINQDYHSFKNMPHQHPIPNQFSQMHYPEPNHYQNGYPNQPQFPPQPWQQPQQDYMRPNQFPQYYQQSQMYQQMDQAHGYQNKPMAHLQMNQPSFQDPNQAYGYNNHQIQQNIKPAQYPPNLNDPYYNQAPTHQQINQQNQNYGQTFQNSNGPYQQKGLSRQGSQSQLNTSQMSMNQTMPTNKSQKGKMVQFERKSDEEEVFYVLQEQYNLLQQIEFLRVQLCNQPDFRCIDLFDHFDLSKSGKITIDIFIKGLQRYGIKAQKQDVELLFQEYATKNLFKQKLKLDSMNFVICFNLMFIAKKFQTEKCLFNKQQFNLDVFSQNTRTNQQIFQNYAQFRVYEPIDERRTAYTQCRSKNSLHRYQLGSRKYQQRITGKLP